MKLGTENSKKTIVAVALFVAAVLMVIRMISGWSSPAPAATPAATAPAPASQTRTARRTSSTRKGTRASAEKNTGPVTPTLDPRLNLAALKQAEETTYDGTGRNIFMATEEPKIEKPMGNGFKQPEVVKNTPPPPPPRPTPPPINLKFFGFASGPDHKRVFLAQGDDVFVASEGDIVQRRYKIVKVNPNNIEVLDVLSNNRQTIPLTAG